MPPEMTPECGRWGRFEMPPEMTPEQALAKLQEIQTITEEIGDKPDIATMMKYLTWLMQDRIEQLKAIANVK